MRHAFAFPADVKNAVRAHVRQAITALNSTRFEQEPAYTAALLARLEGVAYEGDNGFVVFRTTNVNSVGPGTAERWSGADLAVTAEIRRGNLFVRKAILAQAKRGALEDLSPSDRDRLVGQVRQMLRLTRSPKVLFYPEGNAHREPQVASGVRISHGLNTQPVPLADYFIRRILTTLDGDTRSEFVEGVQQSSLRQLNVAARIRRDV